MTDDRDPADTAPSEQPEPPGETQYSTATAMERFEASLPDCPTCGRTVWVVSVTGPLEATASPCGCTIPPSSLEGDRD
ncbi:hypothetical protein [Natrinema salinisoli]|uniref:hypothetical protein n=1 Tax=Natrinema salinisoli TaxID=2878535 RepID=UPI001CF05EFB|nr:hypothetical protein [Natrinema salinisoli]